MSNGAQRVPTQADFDLERIISVLDEAMTSDDPRVLECLRNLMMIVALVKPEVRGEHHARRNGPLRQLFEDMHELNRRLGQVEGELRSYQKSTIHDMEKRLYEQQVAKTWITDSTTLPPRMEWKYNGPTTT